MGLFLKEIFSYGDGCKFIFAYEQSTTTNLLGTYLVVQIPLTQFGEDDDDDYGGDLDYGRHGILRDFTSKITKN